MGKLNMKGATPIGSVALCSTCTCGLILSGFRESEQVMICTRVEPNLLLPFPVHECTGYYDKNRPSWQQMQKLAIRVEDRPAKNAGFKAGLGFAETAISVAVSDDEDDDDNED
ncbi:hypothetical protein [Terriglobus aquaticus]|uniref:Uncharacterized protein n=1 Tax=Terriglobus aquaticus TaxID=940139 RepID=A0ABW9KNP1_9BACT|nr:hypothetical protein [Terriglobus aquaticus]